MSIGRTGKSNVNWIAENEQERIKDTRLIEFKIPVAPPILIYHISVQKNSLNTPLRQTSTIQRSIETAVQRPPFIAITKRKGKSKAINHWRSLRFLSAAAAAAAASSSHRCRRRRRAGWLHDIQDSNRAKVALLSLSCSSSPLLSLRAQGQGPTVRDEKPARSLL